MSRPHTRSQTDVRSDHQETLVRDELMQTSEGDVTGGDVDESVTPPPKSHSENVREEETDERSAELPSSPPPLPQDESVRKWMQDYRKVLRQEQTLLENPTFRLRGNNLANLVKRFQQLSDDSYKLLVDASDDSPDYGR